MTKSRKRKEISKAKQIEALRKELIANDDIFRKNKDQHNIQVQIGMINRGFPQQTMYDSFIDNMKFQIKEAELKLKTKFRVLNPVYEFQKDQQWIDLQIEITEKGLEANKKNVGEVEKNVKEVENEIMVQNDRILGRRIQILDELKKLDYDTSDFTKPNYFG